MSTLTEEIEKDVDVLCLETPTTPIMKSPKDSWRDLAVCSVLRSAPEGYSVRPFFI
jgi:hypothetical protein